jgi:hypothetical protein
MSACSACSGGGEVRWLGNGAANYLTVNNINVPATGSYVLTIDYVTAEVRSFYLSINGGPGIVVTVAAGPNWTTPVSTSTTVTLNAGSNSIRFYNDSAWAPDLDRIIVQ